MQGLIIVESPTKVKTIKKILKRKFDVVASVGHVIDLPKSKIGIDLETFEPSYVTIKGKASVISDIKKRAKKAGKVILATDPDREGEAIAYHIRRKIDDGTVEIHRARFNEITKSGIEQALEELSDIDMDMFYSQQTRRILDRIVGYIISPILWKIMYKGLSAGRVQSAALRLIATRQKEIDGFQREKYWEIFGHFGGIKAKLIKSNGKKSYIGSEETLEEILGELKRGTFVVEDIIRKQKDRKAFAPFITSTLQQDAYNRLGYSAKKTMMLAQKLYEGVSLPEGQTGLITYMRTDSYRVSAVALEEVRSYIKGKIGEKYLPAKPNFYSKKKGSKIQDAHEAIRPTSVMRTPESLVDILEKDMFKLYSLIWKRFVASQMTPAAYDSTQLRLINGAHLFEASGAVMVFDGCERIYHRNGAQEKDMDVAGFKKGEEASCDKIEDVEKETQPPPFYTDASLVKKLEALGIGRPSTYAQIISVLINRQYVGRESKKLICSRLGNIVNSLMEKMFPHIVDYEFTGNMEKDLDLIENGEKEHKKVLSDFYEDMRQWVDKAETDIPSLKQDVIENTDIKCDKCGSPMVIRWGRNGRFLACSGYPDCKNTMDFRIEEGKPVPVKPEEEIQGECPECGSPLIKKRGRYGEFIACSNYPECRYTKKAHEKIGVTCPKCGKGHVIKKRSKRGRYFYGCDRYPDCDFVDWNMPVGENCPVCGSYMVMKGRKTVCSSKECGYVREE